MRVVERRGVRQTDDSSQLKASSNQQQEETVDLDQHIVCAKHNDDFNYEQ